MMKKPLQNPNVQGVLVLSTVVSIALIYILSNQQPTQQVASPVGIASHTPVGLAAWQLDMQEQLSSLPGVTITPAIIESPYVPPTLPVIEATVPGFSASSLQNTATPSDTPDPEGLSLETPTFINNATPLPAPPGLEIIAPEENPEGFALPPELVPLSAGANDHFWLTRPVNVDSNSRALLYYPYGSSGQGWRVHHGLDMPNATGKEVQAAGAGKVIWAGNSSDTCETEPLGELEIYNSYGNFIVIEHDFGWRGQNVYTLYAHLEVMFVVCGEQVRMGELIGLSGATGNVTGPHLHFEVRVGRESYYSTRNPLLWMAPYIDHGVVAGRVIDAEGRYIDNALVQLNRGGRVTDSTTTYINPLDYNLSNQRVWNVVPDEIWQENFAMGDIPAGQYQMVVLVEDQRIFENITVAPGTVTFVPIQIDLAATPQPFQTEQIIATPILPTPFPTALPSATP